MRAGNRWNAARFVDEAAHQLADSTRSDDAVVVAEVTSSDAEVTHGAVVVAEVGALFYSVSKTITWLCRSFILIAFTRQILLTGQIRLKSVVF